MTSQSKQKSKQKSKSKSKSIINQSILTKNSGEHDYNEISYLIKSNELNQNSSIASKTQTLNNTETSLISNIENWIGESKDDSKQFELKYNKISEEKEEKKQKINDGTLPIAKLRMIKLKSSSLFNEDKTTKVMQHKDSKESFKLNINSNIYIPSSSTVGNNKRKDLVINITEEIQAKSKSFVNNLIQNDFKGASGLMFPLSPNMNQINNLNLNINNANQNKNPLHHIAYLTSNYSSYSINSGTTFSCTPKAGNKHHQKFVSDHSIQVKPLSVKNNLLEDGYQFISSPINSNGHQIFTSDLTEMNTGLALQTKKNESKNIVIESILSGKDKRTTVMLRNIPLKYTLNNLVDELNILFNGKYDFINMPINQESKLNLGYAFINFNDPFHIILFNEVFQDRQWMKFKSDKKTSINYAEKQGKKDGGSKDESMFYPQKPKQGVGIEIPIKYYDIFKKILPHSDLYFPKNSIKKHIPVFVVKKVY